jgi:hypothetical protein
MQNSTSLLAQAAQASIELAERAKVKLLGNSYDIFALAAMHIIVAVAVITWMSGNLGAQKDYALPP